jgi:hypothetical protein
LIDPHSNPDREEDFFASNQTILDIRTNVSSYNHHHHRRSDRVRHSARHRRLAYDERIRLANGRSNAPPWSGLEGDKAIPSMTTLDPVLLNKVAK